MAHSGQKGLHTLNISVLALISIQPNAAINTQFYTDD